MRDYIMYQKSDPIHRIIKEKTMFLDLAKARYSCRSYKQDPIPAEKIDAMLEAARLAPTGCDHQPQRIFVCQSPEALAKVRGCTPCHFNAPVVMVICYDEPHCYHRPFDGHVTGYTDTAIVATHIILEAQELGIATCWVAHFDPAKVIQAFDLPKNIVPSVLIPMGYPAEGPCARHCERIPAKDFTKFL